mmetsp:Transcript_33/g.115  ORF Transcript_33/g.115 Transcript_33/m.115 type:complete len:519 (-) Transcript_33:47-1603(-)
MSARLAKKVHHAFKFRGMSARADAVRAVASVLQREPEPDEAMDSIIDAVQRAMERREASSSVVDLATVEQVVAELTRDEEDIAQESIRVFQTADVPKFLYNAARKTFYKVDAPAGLHCPAETNIAMWRERYQLVEQRVLRNAMFSPPVLGSSKREYFQLTPLESLLGTTGTKYVLGMLVQPEEGRYCIEDQSSRVPIDLSAASTTSGLFTECSIVLAQGELREGTFHVAMMGFPPPEKRVDSLLAMGTVDPMGLLTTPHELRKVQALEEEAEASMFVILSDVHLDNPRVFDKVQALLEGFADVVPDVIVFMGNFISAPFGHGADDRRLYAENLTRLADLIAGYPSLANGSKFVFVPGLDDPGGSVLPRAPIPAVFTKALRAQVRNVEFASNPCRLRFYSQDIVLFRHDLVSKMRRHAVVPPTDAHGTFEITEHLVRTVVDQGHLCPMAPTVQPVYWGKDHALRLYPLPQVAILADSFESYHWNYNETTVFNPGPFHEDASFVVYRPASMEAEFSRVDT